MRGKRFFAAVMAALLLAGCAPAEPEPAEGDAVPADAPKIAYVPLDDRPDNVERVVYLAESLGYALAMPETDDYRTALDGQPLNENGGQSGDRGDLFRWVLDQETAGCDRYILSLDQLLSGGLVNSRAMLRHEDITITLPGEEEPRTFSEYQLLGLLLQTLAEDQDNRVWLLDSVMRLAPTVGYQGGTLEAYNALRAYGAEPRPELTGAGLTLGGVEDAYRLGADGRELPLADFGLTDAQAADYLSARSRKLELTHTAMEMLSGLGAENFRVLIGIDDSSEENSIQKNEIAYLRSLLREGDALLSGVDDLAFKAVAGLYLDETDWQGAAVSVQYFGGTEGRPACAYDYLPLEEIVAEHFAFFDLTETAPGSEDFRVVVLTQPADEGQKDAYIRQTVDALNAETVPTVLIDAANGTYGTAFHEALTDQVKLGRLISYAGFLDMAIVTGTALSHGVARYAFLQSGAGTAFTERAFLRTVADSVLKDFCFKHVVRPEMLNYIRGDLQGNPDNFWDPDIDREALLRWLETEMTAATAPVIRNLERSNFITGVDGEGAYLEQGWGDVTLTGYRFPWDRAFEIGMDIRLGNFTRPHQQVGPFWYR